MILRLLASGKYEKALEELELYLPSSPYEDNPTLHTYAGLVCIYLAQPDVSKVHQGSQQDHDTRWDEGKIRQAQQFLERATLLDSTDIVAKTWLDKLPTLTKPQTRDDSPDSDDEGMTLVNETDGEHHKRARTTSS
ncbi:hypothetical protein EIP86_009561 [Pleurotus ostreatoroseus]|nr:hypothetical protein EIP86_009561 [Pleurotus ostreatoroseus]